MGLQFVSDSFFCEVHCEFDLIKVSLDYKYRITYHSCIFLSIIMALKFKQGILHAANVMLPAVFVGFT